MWPMLYSTPAKGHGLRAMCPRSSRGKGTSNLYFVRSAIGIGKL